LNAIDSEHAKNINNDGFRLYQLDKDAANPAHPYSKFATGNKVTLEADTIARGTPSFFYTENIQTYRIIYETTRDKRA